MTPIDTTLRQDVGDAARRVGALDWLMLGFAVLSVGLLAWEIWGDVDEATRQRIFAIDYAICAIFAAEFLWRWRQAGWTRDYVKRNWYEVLGMIPLQHPAVRGFRLFRAVRIIILLSRFGRAADRALGDEFTYRLVNRFKTAIVESISSAVTVAVLDEVEEVLVKGAYARNIARALADNREPLRGLIAEKLREDPQAGRLSRLPFARDMTEAVLDTALRVVEQVLTDPRTDELIADIDRKSTRLNSSHNPASRMPSSA
jgi:hypothetical protein